MQAEITVEKGKVEICANIKFVDAYIDAPVSVTEQFKCLERD